MFETDISKKCHNQVPLFTPSIQKCLVLFLTFFFHDISGERVFSDCSSACRATPTVALSLGCPCCTHCLRCRFRALDRGHCANGDRCCRFTCSDGCCGGGARGCSIKCGCGRNHSSGSFSFSSHHNSGLERRLSEWGGSRCDAIGDGGSGRGESVWRLGWKFNVATGRV